MRLFGAVTMADIENEVRAVQKLCISSHANIVQVFDLGQMKSNSKFHYIDMELCDISLGHYMQGKRTGNLVSWDEFRSDLDNLCNINDDVLDGLVFIHSNNEIHRDLSPQNSRFLPFDLADIFKIVLYSSSTRRWKIADFGLTSPGTSNRLITTRYSRGRACYRAPEMLNEEQGVYSNKADIWSFGCVLFEMITGRRAFAGDFAVFQYYFSST